MYQLKDFSKKVSQSKKESDVQQNTGETKVNYLEMLQEQSRALNRQSTVQKKEKEEQSSSEFNTISSQTDIPESVQAKMENSVNSDPALESEADTMGKLAAGGEKVSPQHSSVDNHILRKQSEPQQVSNTPPGHGVTNASAKILYSKVNGKQKKSAKEKQLPAEKAVNVIGDADNGQSLLISVEIDGDVYEGTVLKAVINVTPNSFEEINPQTLKNIERGKVPGKWLGKKATDVCNLCFSTDIPQILHAQLISELDGMVNSDTGLKLTNQTVSMGVKFAFPPEQIKNNKAEAEEYNDKTFAFRFTRFNNGNIKDIILIEMLGKVNTGKKLNEEEKGNVENLFAQYNLSFIEPDNEALKATDELKVKLNEGAGAQVIQPLHAKSYMKLDNNEKEAILTSVLKMPESVLKEIEGLKFGKKYCRLDKNDNSKAAFPGAYYTNELHEVVLVGAGSQVSSTIFGDKGNTNFTTMLDYSVTHEIGHAADYSEYRKDKTNTHKTIDDKEEALTNAKLLFDEADKLFIPAKEEYDEATGAEKQKLQPNYKKLRTDREGKVKEYNALGKDYNAYFNSLVLKEYLYRTYSGSAKKMELENGKFTYKEENQETDFTEANRNDAPALTEYSRTGGIKEAFADGFALYFSEPETLKVLSPDIYKYFEQKYGKK